MSARHLTPDEMVERVFPVGEDPAPVPMHLAICAECQHRVARLREGLLIDRGALTGIVEALPEEFWRAQARAVMERVRAGAAPVPLVPFPSRLKRSIFRRPALAVGSLAAALVLVAALSILGPGRQAAVKSEPALARATPAAAAPTELSPADRADDELLRAVDRMLSQDVPQSDLLPEGV